MAHNQPGIAITIKAWLPSGKDLDAAHKALSIVKEAHETGNYATLLAAAQVEDVKTTMTQRRVEEAPVAVAPVTVAAAPWEEDDAA